MKYYYVVFSSNVGVATAFWSSDIGLLTVYGLSKFQENMARKLNLTQKIICKPESVSPTWFTELSEEEARDRFPKDFDDNLPNS